MTPLALAFVLLAVSLATLILRRSLLAAAAAIAQGSLALASHAAASDREHAAVVIALVGVALTAGVVGVAVAVHRHRATDHIDELRELQG